MRPRERTVTEESSTSTSSNDSRRNSADRLNLDVGPFHRSNIT
jgi:hypothetical protein